MKENRQMDEMERHILLRSQAFGYRAAMLVLATWVIYKSTMTLVKDAAFDPLPAILMWIPMGVQWVSNEVMKRKMTAGDEEYKEPNTTLKKVAVAIVAAALIMWLITFFVLAVTR